MTETSNRAEHHRKIAHRFRERAAATPNLRLRESYRDMATEFERMAGLAEAEDRLRGGPDAG